MEKRVAIIGAGISGLLACKYAASRGFNPVVLEAEEQVGGLWNHTIESTRLQNVKEFFQFSDFPWPSSVQEALPTNAQLLEYLQSYARHFELLPYIKFNCKVISVDYVGECEEEMQSWELWGGSGKAFGSKGKWNLKVLHTKQDSLEDYVSEFVVICTGRFSGLPEIPTFPPGHGPEVFSGKVLHSMDYSAMDNASAAEFIKGKRIAVIGSGKSAVDVAFECANANGNDIPCTVIQRTIHWMLPLDAQPWGLSLGFLCFSRFAELLVHKPGEGVLSSVLATLLSPLRWGLSKLIESYLRWKLPLKKYNMIPEENVLREASSCQLLFLPPNFYDKVEDGSIILKKSQRFSFCKEGLILDGEDDPVKADIVIYATGYKGDEKLKNIFSSPTFQNCIAGSPTSTIPLYRQMIHPRIPQLAVISYSESLSNLYTFEMRCKWLGYFLDEAFKLPSIKEMEEDMKMWDKYMKKYSGNGRFRRACIGGVPIWYNDQLCRDIGCNPRRKKGFFADLFEPYGLADYKEL
ncbi:putative flavin-containing monooxygenase 1 [Sesamum alatum]|uniref:Flavin-containing monooxygenase n=1 Tax=Sesamum alatum TaxID=300844 RepID=A0AAE1YLM2_9LAMI|nr:putative flavin-containing monooxygenase 1 [Sesamum alatum]